VVVSLVSPAMVVTSKYDAVSGQSTLRVTYASSGHRADVALEVKLVIQCQWQVCKQAMETAKNISPSLVGPPVHQVEASLLKVHKQPYPGLKVYCSAPIM
jgi:hypothetical protein